MLKQDFLLSPPPTRQRRNGRLSFAGIFLLCSALAIARHWWRLDYHLPWPSLGTQHEQLSPSRQPFDWDRAPTSRTLEYADCYGDFQCAKLELPMDYWNGSTNATISLAVLRRPAAVPVTDKRYGGAVLLNPGGPGGSGVGLALGAGEAIQKIIDSPESKYFDIIGFDPRGVGLSTPSAYCIADYNMAQSWHLRVLEEGVMGSSDASFGRLWSMAIARGQSCSLPLPKGEPNIKQYMTTASVARDMVSLVEAHGAWREKQALQLLNGGHRCSASVELPEALKHKHGEEKLQYWGFSYGSYLGMTFAAMFPDRVHRLIVDGVVDAVDYTKTLWYDNLVDTEKDIDLLYYHCARVGWPTCALGNETAKTTAEGVKRRVENITKSVWHNPLPIIGDYPEVVEWSDVKNLLFSALYSPIASYPGVAKLLLDIEQGNGTQWAGYLRAQHQFYCPAVDQQAARFSLHLPTTEASLATAGPMDATLAVACTDGDDQSFVDRDAFAKHLKRLVKLSPSIGAIWATFRLHCIHYSVRALHRYPGPFEGNTSHPVLFLGNTADPVTPLRNAINMAKGYTGAVALTQDSPGHCTLAAPSSCTAKYVRQYFQSGELPPKNTTCKADYEPFGPTPGEVHETSVEEKELKLRVKKVHDVVLAVGGGFMGQHLPRIDGRDIVGY